MPLSPQYDVSIQASTGIVPQYKWYKEVVKNIVLRGGDFLRFIGSMQSSVGS